MVTLYATIASGCWMIGSRNWHYNMLFQRKSMCISTFTLKSHGRCNLWKNAICVDGKLMSLDCVGVILEGEIENQAVICENNIFTLNAALLAVHLLISAALLPSWCFQDMLWLFPSFQTPLN